MYHKPIFFASRDEIPDGVEVRDVYANSVQELFFVRHPKFKTMNDEALVHFEKFKSSILIDDVYIYYPPENICIRTVGEKYFFELRTARNRNLISSLQQQNYRDIKLGIIGLSIGSGALNSVVRAGGSKYLKIADPDILEITNLNRLNANFTDVGLKKIDIACRNIYLNDPFAEVAQFEGGIDENNLDEFLIGRPRLDCVVDALDNLRIKFLLREKCRQYRIPVVMGTDIGDNVILDVERYDVDDNYQAFHGAMGDMKADDLQNMPYPEWVKVATRIVDPNVMPKSILDSVRLIGSHIAGVPQLGTTVAITGSLTALAVRMIANGENLKSGRYVFEADALLDRDLTRSDKIDELKNLRKEILKIISS